MQTRRKAFDDGVESEQQLTFSDFAKADGVVYAKKSVAFRDGKKCGTATITECRFFEKLDAKAFDIPSKVE